MKVKKHTVTLIECKNGVLWNERERYYKNLASARRAVMRDAKQLAKHWGAVATIIDFEPLTEETYREFLKG